MTPSSYCRLVFELSAGEDELFSVELWARGARGLEIESHGAGVRVIAYCDDPVPSELDLGVDSWRRRGIRLVERGHHRERDWLANYRRHCRPFEIGDRFLVDPREPGGSSSPNGRIVLRVPARRAFGTGAHASTRLVLEWLEELDLRGRSVLDLGSGSAVLSMAAVRLGAGRAVGVDIDPVAAFVARDTVRLNGLDVRLVAGGLACLGGGSFDVALVNILPHRWLGEAVKLAGLMSPDGLVIVSGVPSEEAGTVGERLRGSGWIVAERRVTEDWTAMRLARPAA